MEKRIEKLPMFEVAVRAIFSTHIFIYFGKWCNRMFKYGEYAK